LKSSLIEGVASLERARLLAFYYLSASEIWPDKRDDHSLFENIKSGKFLLY